MISDHYISTGISKIIDALQKMADIGTEIVNAYRGPEKITNLWIDQNQPKKIDNIDNGRLLKEIEVVLAGAWAVMEPYPWQAVGILMFSGCFGANCSSRARSWLC